RQQYVNQAGEYDVDPAAEEACEQADEAAGDGGDGDGDERTRHRGRRAIDHAGIEIAAEVICAEPVRGAGAEQLLGGNTYDRAMTREQAWRQRPGNYDRDDREGKRNSRR